MFVRLCSSVENKQKVINELQVVGLVFSRKWKKKHFMNTGILELTAIAYLGFKLRMLIMDCTNGYACRLRGTTTAVFSGKRRVPWQWLL
jgi:hypothetical protein